MSSFLGPFEDVGQGMAAGAFPAAAGASSNPLPFAMQTQQATNWCWAATAASVLAYYDGVGAPNQCSLASQYVAVPYCPPPPISDTGWLGNQIFSLADVLQHEGHLAAGITPGALDFADIIQDIDNCRPVCIHVATAPDGHFLAIIGYEDNGQDEVYVCDPEKKLHGWYPHDTLSSAAGGSWDESYRT